MQEIPQEICDAIAVLFEPFLKEKFLAILEDLARSGLETERELLASLDFMRLAPVTFKGAEYRLYYSPYYSHFTVKPTRPTGVCEVLQDSSLLKILQEWRSFSLELPIELQTKKRVSFVRNRGIL